MNAFVQNTNTMDRQLESAWCVLGYPNGDPGGAHYHLAQHFRSGILAGIKHSSSSLIQVWNSGRVDWFASLESGRLAVAIIILHRREGHLRFVHMRQLMR